MAEFKIGDRVVKQNTESDWSAQDGDKGQVGLAVIPNLYFVKWDNGRTGKLSRALLGSRFSFRRGS